MTDESPEQTIRENLGLAVLILHAAGHLDAMAADKAYRSAIGQERVVGRSEKDVTAAFARIEAATPNWTPARI